MQLRASHSVSKQMIIIYYEFLIIRQEGERKYALSFSLTNVYNAIMMRVLIQLII